MKMPCTLLPPHTPNVRYCRRTDCYQTSSDGNNLFLGDTLMMVSMSNNSPTFYALSVGSSLSAAISVIGARAGKFTFAPEAHPTRIHPTSPETRRRFVAPSPIARLTP
jgi:hypothetical protein